MLYVNDRLYKVTCFGPGHTLHGKSQDIRDRDAMEEWQHNIMTVRMEFHAFILLTSRIITYYERQMKMSNIPHTLAFFDMALVQFPTYPGNRLFWL